MNKHTEIDILNFCGFDLSPLPLDFTNELTTTKWLGALLKKLNTVLEFTQNIYEYIIKDLEDGGKLYELLTSKFTAEITEIQNTIKTIEDRLAKLEYTEPIININDTVYNYSYGDTVNGATIQFDITNNSEDVERVDLYKDGELVNSISNSKSGFISYTGAITDSTTFTIKAYDGVKEVEKEIKYNFYTPFYFSEVSAVPNENIIKSTFNKKLVTENTYFYIVQNCSNLHPCIVSDHDLTIYDENNNLITDSFEVSEITIKLDSARNYKVYLLKNSITVDKFKFKILY